LSGQRELFLQPWLQVPPGKPFWQGVNRTVLFVDDEPEVLHGFAAALRREPYRVLFANSATEALFVLQAEAVDVIVADERMPGVSGRELLATARRLYPGTVRLLLTSHALPTPPSGGAIFRVLLKPCGRSVLREAIGAALNERARSAAEMPHRAPSHTVEPEADAELDSGPGDPPRATLSSSRLHV
jgi:CheY-like chemotaxis protein